MSHGLLNTVIGARWSTLAMVSALCLGTLGCGGESSNETATTQVATQDAHDHEGNDQTGLDPVPDAAAAGTVVESMEPAPEAGVERPEADRERAPGPLRVVVSTPTLLWPLEDLLGDKEKLDSILAPGESVHGFELTPEDVALIDQADVLVVVGLGLDTPITRAADNRPSPHRTVINLGDIAVSSGQVSSDLYHDHDHDHSHDHAHADPHIWLIPDVMALYALELGTVLENGYERIGQLTNENLARIQQEAGNAADKASIANLTFTTRLVDFDGRGIVTNHAAFGIFLELYGLQEFAVLQPNTEVEPTPEDIKSVVDAIREHELKALIVVPGHDRSAAEKVAELTGVELIEMDPVGDGDWPKLMGDLYIALYKSFTGEHPSLD